MNGGRLGAPTRTAELNNTLTVNNKNHDTFTGGGTQEGILMPTFDYAKGLDGNAMNNVQHARNLFLIHSDYFEDLGGYKLRGYCDNESLLKELNKDYLLELSFIDNPIKETPKPKTRRQSGTEEYNAPR